ncbi:MAG: hypothetical protein II890_06265 [Spirochaetia bacterium]|nr:hypothetical protein [Spirochaetia bacterium]
MKKFLVLIMAILLVFTFTGCGGGGGGSDDDDDDDATWPVEYYYQVGGSPVSAMRTAPATGTYKYIYFYKDNTYKSGDLNDGILSDPTGEGTYSGGDPHNNVTIILTGSWEGYTLSGESVSISSGSLSIKGKTFSSTVNGSGGNNDSTPTPAVIWPVSFQADISAMTGVPGTFGYVDFREDGTYIYGDGAIRVTGHWTGSDANNLLINITSGVFDFGGIDMVRQ